MDMKILHVDLDGLLQEEGLVDAPQQSLFTSLYKSKWDEIHNKTDTFRYKINNIQEKVLENHYIMQLNPDRAINRRTPELISNMNQPFNNERFNFTKVSSDEIMFSIGKGVGDLDLHSFIVNVSPISQYHSLFVPFINQKLPQVMTKESLNEALRVMFIANDKKLKMGFNSLCGLASVNHLHFHMFIESHILPVERTPRKNVVENLWFLLDYPIPAFVYLIPEITSKHLLELHCLIRYLQDEAIAHNVMMMMAPGGVEVYVFPRRSSTVKQLMDFNVAVCELSGWFPVHNERAFLNLSKEDLEDELKKWKYEKFEELLNIIPDKLYSKSSCRN